MKPRIHATLLAVGMLFAPTLFIALGDYSAPGRIDIVGFSAMAAAMWLWALDLWLPFPRPKPRLGTRCLLVPVTRMRWIAALVFFTGCLALVASSVVAETVMQEMLGRRGWSVPFMLVLAPGGTLLSIVMVVWRGRLVITRAGLRSRLFVNEYRMQWDDMYSFELDTSDDIESVEISLSDGQSFTIPEGVTRVPIANWIDTLTHYRDHPEDRDEIGTQASLDRLTRPSPPTGSTDSPAMSSEVDEK